MKKLSPVQELTSRHGDRAMLVALGVWVAVEHSNWNVLFGILVGCVILNLVGWWHEGRSRTTDPKPHNEPPTNAQDT